MYLIAPEFKTLYQITQNNKKLVRNAVINKGILFARDFLSVLNSIDLLVMNVS